MTGPLDESKPLEDAMVDGEIGPTADVDGSEILRELRREVERLDGWRRVEALVDLLIAERAQRVVDGIIERRRREMGDQPS